MIIEKDFILNNKIHKKTEICGIYFLLKNKEIVYIGQSVNFYKRMFEHENKSWDSYFFKEVPLKDLNKVEALNIIKYKPRYNKSINEDFLSIKMIKSRLKLIGIKAPLYYKKNIINIIESKNIKFKSLNLKGCFCDYITKEEFEIVLEEILKCI